MAAVGSVTSNVIDLANRADADAIADQVNDDVARAVFPDRMDDAAFMTALHHCSAENVHAIIHMFAGRLEALEANPQGALAFADLTAELGIPIGMVERAYWVGVSTFWREWFDLAGEAAEAGRAPLHELVRDPTLALFAYIDHVLESVLSRYETTRAELIRTRAHLRSQMLGEVIAGTVEREGDELDDALGYRLRHHHLALVISLDEGQGIDAEVAQLQAALGATAALLHQEGARTWVVWLGRARDFTHGERQALRAVLAAGEVRVAVGDPAAGLDGLRRTREQALKVAGVQRALEPALGRVLWYTDVRLETLLLADPVEARAFVAEELGPLAAQDRRCGQIRRTLLAWLTTGTQAGAAVMLGLHENTIRARIRQAEELLPGALGTRRTELQVALRLDAVLGDD